MEKKSTYAIIVGDINQLPEECISHMISLTTPRDACVSSTVSCSFRSVADSDATWQPFLPSDYALFLSKAVNPVEYASKKELYFRLCDHPLLIDGGFMSFGLEKSSGVKCFMLSARALKIMWRGTIYCKWISLPDSRFSECAEIYRVSLLEIHGKIDSRILTPNTAYAAYLVFKYSYALGVSYGLRNPYQTTKITLAGDIVSEHSVCLSHREREQVYARPLRRLPGGEIEEMSDDVRLPIERQDGWLEVELGEFDSGEGIDGEVDMSFMGIRGGPWKHGLIVQGIEVRLKH